VTRPQYWSRARRALAAADPVLGSIIHQHPRVALASRGDAFATLARSIVGQQISVKAADAVWTRLRGACPQLTPAVVLRRRATTLRGCGLSERKVEYLRDLAAHFADGRVEPREFAEMDDEAIIERLTDIRGIGRWTAEMFLIFNLLRPNVLPLDDLGLLKAVSLHYLQGVPTRELLARAGREQVRGLAAAWNPWSSVATWYLWRSLDPVPVEY
jgi:DNA-3-methyladenine glycosylase II